MRSAETGAARGGGGSRLDHAELRSDPLHTRVYTLLKNWILDGRLRPGERLRSTSLAAQLKVSRTPVGDALRRLEQDRLIVPAPGQAYVVYSPTRQDLEDLYEVRVILEGSSARLAAARHATDHFDQMGAILADMEQAYARADLRTLVDLDMQFHEHLVAAGGNPVLLELYTHLATRLRHLRAASGNPVVRQRPVLEQHTAILAALRRGDPEAAERATRQHILSVCALARAAFPAAPPRP